MALDSDVMSLAGGALGFGAGLMVSRLFGRKGRVMHTVAAGHDKPGLRGGCAGCAAAWHAAFKGATDAGVAIG